MKPSIQKAFHNAETVHWYAAERANRRMNKHGRKEWNAKDRLHYLKVYYDILEKVAGPDHPAVVAFKASP